MNQLANVLALAGRREDNAAHGGQVAHISAAEAELLKRMGGASTRNPVTGLPEYWAMGFGPPAVAQAAALGFGAGGAASGGMGPAANAAPMGIFGPPPSRGGRSSSPSPAPSVVPGGPMGFTVAGPASAMGQAVSAAAGDGGMGFVVGPIAQANAQAQAQAVANATPGDGSGFGIVTTTDGTPVTTLDGVPVQHANLSGRVANTAIIPADIANAKFFNQLGEATEGIPNMVLAFLSQMAQAQTPQNVANTRGAIALAGPGMGAPSGPAGGQYARPVDPKTKSRVPTDRIRSALIDAIGNAAVETPGTIKVSTDPVQVTSPISQGLANVIASQTGRFSPEVESIRERFFRQLA